MREHLIFTCVVCFLLSAKRAHIVILRRYMTQQVASTTALVLGFLVVLMLGGRLIRYFGIAAEGRLDVGLLFAIIGYNLPYFLELILPLSFFIALMLVFGRLYVDHEMAVINGSGISRGRLARLTTPLILLLFVFEAGLSLVGKPWGVRQSDSVWQQQAMQSAFELIRPGSFISSGNYHLYVGSLSEDKKYLQDLILIQTQDQPPVVNANTDTHADSTANTDQPAAAQQQRQQSMNSTQAKNEAAIAKQMASLPQLSELPQLPDKYQPAVKDIIILAKRAEQVDSGVSDHADKIVTQLDLHQGRRYEISADNLKYNQIGFERYRISLSQDNKQKVTEQNIETQPLGALWQAARNQANLPAQAELGYRLALPWLMIIAPMLAVPLAQVQPRQGRWLRLLPAILLFVSAALAIISLKNAVSKGKYPVWAYLWVVLGFMMGALYLNWRSRIHHRVRFGRWSRKRRLSDFSETTPSSSGTSGTSGGQSS